MGWPFTSAMTVPMYMKVPEEAPTAGRVAGRVAGAMAIVELSAASAPPLLPEATVCVGAPLAPGWNDCALIASGRCLELPHPIKETKRASARETAIGLRCISSIPYGEQAIRAHGRGQ